MLRSFFRFLRIRLLGFLAVFSCWWPLVAAPAKDVSLDPKGNESSYSVALGLLAKGNFELAITAFTELIQTDPLDARFYYSRADAYGRKADYEHAIEDCDNLIRLKPSAAGNYAFRGQMALWVGDYQTAIDHYTIAISKLPKAMNWYWNRGIAYQKAKQPYRAVLDFSEALRLNPNNVEFLLARAGVYKQQGAYAEALDDLELGLIVASSRPELYLARGDVYEKRGDYGKAFTDFAQALRLDPKSAKAYNELAWGTAVLPDPEIRNGKRAVVFALKILELSGPRITSGHLDTVAAAYAEDGQFDLAIKYQRQALALALPDKKESLQKHLDLYIAHQPFHETPPDPKAIDWDDKRYACFDLVWKTVDQEYFDTSLAGVDWRAVREKYRLPLSEAENDAQLRGVLQDMLNELHRTHFAIVPRSTAVFSPEERVRQGTVGAGLAYIDHQVVVGTVQAKSAAEKAGLKPGDAIISFDGITIESAEKSLHGSGLSPSRVGLYLKDSMEARFGGKVGSELKLVVQGADGQSRNIDMKCASFDGVWSDPVGNFPSEPIALETVRHDDGIAYARFNIFALPIVKDLKTFFRSLKPGDGLIIDLRGNPGGALIIAPGLTGWLSDKEFSMGTIHMRDTDFPLDVYPQSRAFTGPVAVLIDGSSASTSEVFAGGLREMKRARIFGETSAGAALPSAYKRLPNDDLFQYAIGDIRTPSGHLLEGGGVEPDQSIKVSRAEYAAQNDPVIAAATAWLQTQRHSALAPSKPGE